MRSVTAARAAAKPWRPARKKAEHVKPQRKGCQPQLHKRELSGHSATSYRLLLVWSQRSGPSLTWSGRRWPQAHACRWSSSTVDASGWRFGGCSLSSQRFMVSLSGSSRKQRRVPPRGRLYCHICVPLGLLLVSCSKVSSLWCGVPLHSRRTTFASSSQCRLVQAHHLGSSRLLAVRLWLPGTRVLARVRSDSLSALRSMVRLSSKFPDLNVLALDAVLGLYTAEHATQQAT